MKDLITIQDAIIVPFLLIVVYFIATKIKNNNIEEQPHYKYFRIGLFVKIWAGLAFAAVYIFYYGGGDTMYYFMGTGNIVKMFGKDIPTFFKILGGNHSAEVASMFDRTTGYPTYFRDPNSFAVCRFNLPFYLLGLGSFLGNTIIMNFFLYFGIWRFYKMLVDIYPNNEKWLAYALFFIPNVVFWSSGILKDGWTFIAILFMYTNIWQIFVKKEKVWSNIIWLIVWAYISISIRPYIFYVAMASALIWLGFGYIKKIESHFLRVIIFPILLFLLWSTGSALFIQTSSLANSKYASVDAILETAWIIQDDLKRDYYGGNSFDIGYFEPTIPGVIRKAPQAIIAGIFRPFIWEGSGILMLFSGIENLILLLLFWGIILKTRLIGFIRHIYKDPLLISFTTMLITLAFFVGLTTANFGALVRYNILVKTILVLILASAYNNKYCTSNQINNET